MRFRPTLLLFCLAICAGGPLRADDFACNVEVLVRLTPNFTKKLYRPLFSTNVDALKVTKINKVWPSPNMFLMTPDRWLAPDSEFKEQVELRHRLYANRPNDILVIDPAQEARVQAAGEELLAMVSKHLAEQFPDTYEIANGQITIKPLGKSFSLTNNSEMHPLAKVGLLAQDDFTISLIAPNNGPVTMYGGFLATPTNWAMQDFLSMPVHEIHSGVVGYEEKLKKTVEGAVMSHNGKIMGRNNWFIESNPELALPSYRTSTYHYPEVTAGNISETMYLRSELESIFVLPNSKAAVFSIRPRVWALPRVKEQAPEIAQQISEALPVSQYSGEFWAGPLAKYLNTGVTAPPAPERPAGPPPGVFPPRPPSVVLPQKPAEVPAQAPAEVLPGAPPARGPNSVVEAIQEAPLAPAKPVLLEEPTETNEEGPEPPAVPAAAVDSVPSTR